MSISVFDIFKIGVGPSSSHTMGPMSAAARFVNELKSEGLLGVVTHVTAELYGSLALTGKGHCTDTAILLGLQGIEPHALDPDDGERRVSAVREHATLSLAGCHEVVFDEALDLIFLNDQFLPQHPNGMRFSVYDAHQAIVRRTCYFSTGGGFFVSASEIDKVIGDQHARPLPFAFKSGRQLLQLCHDNRMSIAELALENEKAFADEPAITRRLLALWQVMQACVQRGFQKEGLLPGVLKVKRRAPKMYQKMTSPDYDSPTLFMDWVTAWALAVNEENAAGGKVVTAPTNGAAGIVPAVIHYYERFEKTANTAGICQFLLVAGCVGALYKMNASISGAEMGCQGEVGVACSMAAAGLTAALGGSNGQVENAAEIGMEHNLGLTCDPVAGLVQIPCIERNAMGAIKAINAARLALGGDGTQKVSLDQVIETMRQTGEDMNSVYKETARGGLAVNVTEC